MHCQVATTDTIVSKLLYDACCLSRHEKCARAELWWECVDILTATFSCPTLCIERRVDAFLDTFLAQPSEENCHPGRSNDPS